MTNTHLSHAGGLRPVGMLPRGPVSAGPRGGRRDPIATVSSLVGCVAVCSALAGAILLPEKLDHIAVVVALVGVVLGIPHGAVDHMVPFWVAGIRPSPRDLAVGLVGYLLVAVLAAAALILVPAPVVVLFLVVSALHFGRGEVTFAAERAGRPTPGWSTDLPTTLVHGAVVVLLPLTLWHDRAVPVLEVLAPSLAHPVPRPVLLFVATLTVLAALAVAGTLLRAGRRREALELLLILALFVVVPPLVAFGVYFGAWHAVRHTGRLLALPGPDGPLRAGAALRRYVLHAAGPTVVSLAALVAADRIVTGAAVPVALAVLLALTFPHLRTVAQLDRMTARQH